MRAREAGGSAILLFQPSASAVHGRSRLQCRATVDSRPPWEESRGRCCEQGVTRLHGVAQVNSILSTETSMESQISGYGISAPRPVVSIRPQAPPPRAQARSRQLSVRTSNRFLRFPFRSGLRFAITISQTLRKARARGLETECKLHSCLGLCGGTADNLKGMIVQFADTLMGLAGSLHPPAKVPAFMQFRTRTDQFNNY